MYQRDIIDKFRWGQYNALFLENFITHPMPKEISEVKKKYTTQEINIFDSIISCLSNHDFNLLEALTEKLTQQEEEHFESYLQDLSEVEDFTELPQINSAYSSGQFVLDYFSHIIKKSIFSNQLFSEPKSSKNKINY